MPGSRRNVLRWAAALVGCVALAGCASGPPVATGRVASADGVAIAYARHGSARSALVLVHGWSCNRDDWQAQAAALSDRFTVVTLDLAGHGGSGTDRHDWTIAAFGADVAAVARHLALDDIVLVGNGMGGDVIVDAARRLPGRVRGLVWVDTYREMPSRRTPERLEAFIAALHADFPATVQAVVRGLFGAGADPALVDRIAGAMAAAPPAIAVPTVRAALEYAHQVPALLATLDLPVVAINPEQPASDAAALQRHGVELASLPDVGHFAMLEAPERFNALLAQHAARMFER